jgi:hypothetical protein
MLHYPIADKGFFRRNGPSENNVFSTQLMFFFGDIRQVPINRTSMSFILLGLEGSLDFKNHRFTFFTESIQKAQGYITSDCLVSERAAA